ncbi:DUF4258 domain-containing protein [Candidatus Woesearchaeota archaeon]|nr:DUF4258 domain-containing protein [Candidatus Woesearchaeota archaeon]
MKIEEWKDKIRQLSLIGIEFDPHFSLRIIQRNLSSDEIIHFLRNPNNLESVEQYKNEGFRLVFKKSSKFQLVIGVQFISKGLYIKTAFRRLRKCKLRRL